MTFQFSSLDHINRCLLSVDLVQGTLLGPLGNIKVSDPTGVELADLLQEMRCKSMQFHVIVQGQR